MSERAAGDPSARLVEAYARIARERMAGLPFVNPRLEVEAVGFRPWKGQWLGVLVTPWSVNLVLAPGDGDWVMLAHGAERYVAFPAGRFRFIAGGAAEAGEHHACSLFSPALEFVDAEAARLTARAALDALLDPANAEDAPLPQRIARRDFLAGRIAGSPDAAR
jgi:[NiFe] hydrogenase assembly HybE family chaperone